MSDLTYQTPSPARLPQPSHAGLFLEPVYPDGPYDRGDEDDEDDGFKTGF